MLSATTPNATIWRSPPVIINVLEEVDHLALVGKVAMERQRGHKAKQREGGGGGASPEAGDK
jgi:hypothetical protein